MVNGRKWTNREIVYLKANYFKTDYHEIAEKLERSYSAIMNKKEKLKLPTIKGKKFSEKSRKKMSDTRKRLLKEGKVKLPNQLSKKEKEQILKLHKEGKLKTLEIAEKVGCSRVSVSRYTKPKRDKKRAKQINKFKDNLNKLSESDRGYIAGILDGEGSIIIQTCITGKSKGTFYTGAINISNQDTQIISYIHKRLGLWTKIRLSKKEKNANLLKINIYGKEMIKEFLKFILNYIHSKKTGEKAKIMLRFCKAKTHEERKELYDKMRGVRKMVDYNEVPISRYTRGEREEQVNEFKKNLNKLSESDRGYLAGIIDGEGSIIIIHSTIKNKKYYLASVVFGNEDKKIINWVYKRLKTRAKLYLDKKTQKYYFIKIHGKKTIRVFLNFILPYCHSEKTEKRAKIMLEFCKVKTHKEREKLYKKLRIYFNRKNIVNK